MRVALAVALLLAGCATVRLAPVIDQQARIVHAEPEDVARACWDRGARVYRVLACYDPTDDVILLPFPHRIGAALYREVRNHEACHRLGWPADHSGPRPKGCQ